MLAEADRVANDDLPRASFVTQIGEPLYNLVEKGHRVEGRRCGSVSGVLVRFGADVFEFDGSLGSVAASQSLGLRTSLRDETNQIRGPPIRF